ncbi:MAG TPA: D-2-hydroxyacid dehydrogenase [Chloroflexaceae bacterium]|nr:D-2-hydroxyacid dehydrogenase [Chloroflexaceae bacterium]
MKIIVPSQIRDLLAPRLPAEVTAVWANPDATFEGDPAGAAAYFRWWGEQNVYEHVLRRAPELRWVHTPSAGVEHLLTPAVLERDLTLTNSAGVHAIPIAEFVLAFMLSRAKGLPEYRAAQAEARWARGLELRELYEATLLILGIGGIGGAIAERAAAFGMRVWGSRRSQRPTPHAERVVTGDEWRALLPEADYVVVAAPLTPETRGMVDAAALAAMKPTAYLINIARGQLVDEAALAEALRAGRIGGAALDTFEQEPLPADSPLWGLPNVTITPHATANSPRMRERQIALFLDNLQRFRNGQPLRNVVDKAAGY